MRLKYAVKSLMKSADYFSLELSNGKKRVVIENTMNPIKISQIMRSFAFKEIFGRFKDKRSKKEYFVNIREKDFIFIFLFCQNFWQRMLHEN